MNIKIDYNGSYPNLCSGELVVTIDGKAWNFPSHCLSSGGGVSFDNDWKEHVSSGKWGIDDWPTDFPSNPTIIDAVEQAVNDQIPWGCCGGCV